MLRLLTLALVSLVAVSTAQTDPPKAVVRGVIESVAPDGASLTVKAKTGESVAVKIGEKTRIVGIVRASAADLKPDSYIGVAALPDTGDTLMALEVHIFPASMRGTGDGYRPFDLAPKSSMTNGVLNGKIGGTNGDMLTVQYKNGSKQIRLPPDAPIVAFAPADKADVKAGVAAVVRGDKAADGGVDAGVLLVGKDGVVPPM